MTLWPIFLNHDGRVIHKWKHYFPIYERHFGRYVNQPVLFLEIGCGEGGSLQMWKRYLGPHAQIVGIDIRPECRAFEEDQIAIRIGSQDDTAFLQSVIDEFGAPHIVLDDGSHVMAHLEATFRYLYPRTAPEGVFAVEDLHTAYWDEYGGGLKRPGSFIEICKDLMDELNAEHSRGSVAETEFSRTTLSMHVYDSVVVFEKGRHLPKSAPRMGTPTAAEDVGAGRSAEPEAPADSRMSDAGEDGSSVPAASARPAPSLLKRGADLFRNLR